MNEKLYTFDEFQNLLNDVTKRFVVAQTNELLTRKNILADMLYMGYVPPTRWQKFKYRMQDIKQRCKDIWTILTGGDIHKNCGY